jgi:acetyl esterase/lipase
MAFLAAVASIPAQAVEPTILNVWPTVQPNQETPPMFMVHAWDDGVTPLSSILLAAELKRANVSCELHLYSKGGHGYGLRHVDGVPVTDWSVHCQAWLANLLK